MIGNSVFSLLRMEYSRRLLLVAPKYLPAWGPAEPPLPLPQPGRWGTCPALSKVGGK